MRELLDSLAWIVVIVYFVAATANIILRAWHSRLRRKVRRKREYLDIINKRPPKGVEWPTNEQLRILTKYVEECGSSDDKKVLSAMMKSREFFGGGKDDEIPKGVQREIDEALEIVRKANPK